MSNKKLIVRETSISEITIDQLKNIESVSSIESPMKEGVYCCYGKLYIIEEEPQHEPLWKFSRMSIAEFVKWKDDVCNKERIFSNEMLFGQSLFHDQIENIAIYHGIVINTSKKNGFVIVSGNDIYHFYKE